MENKIQKILGAAGLVGLVGLVGANIALQSETEKATLRLADDVRGINLEFDDDNAEISQDGNSVTYAGKNVSLSVKIGEVDDWGPRRTQGEVYVRHRDLDQDCYSTINFSSEVPSDKVFGPDVKGSVTIYCLFGNGENDNGLASIGGADFDCAWKAGPQENCFAQQIGNNSDIPSELRSGIGALASAGYHGINDAARYLVQNDPGQE